MLEEMQTPDPQLKYLLALHRGLNLTSHRFEKLKIYFQSDWKRCYTAKISEWQRAEVDEKGITKFFSKRPELNPDKELALLHQCNATVLIKGTSQYPHSLLHTYDAPPLLFCRGNLKENDFPSISVVGSRKISSYGKRAGEQIVKELALRGITIISGLAYGVDMLAHQTAVAHQSRTIAVLGNGIDSIYPQAHSKQAEHWLEEDKLVILSEHLPGTPGIPEYFPRRNRIVTGLSRATIVVEAAAKSGSLISAELALEQNREVFAVPGEIFSPTSTGCNQLIADQKAIPALSGDQILSHLGLNNLSEQRQAQTQIPKIGIEADILRLFQGNEKYHIDDLSRNSVIPHHQLTSTLMIMEMKGLVQQLSNQLYVKNC